MTHPAQDAVVKEVVEAIAQGILCDEAAWSEDGLCLQADLDQPWSTPTAQRRVMLRVAAPAVAYLMRTTKSGEKV